MPLLKHFLLIFFFQLTCISTVWTNIAPIRTKTQEDNPSPICDSSAESRVLCEASARQEATIAQVIAEDETAHLEQTQEPPSSDDVWQAAYNQWVNPNPGEKATQRALDEARKRYGKEQENNSINAAETNILDDDEVVKITEYAQTLSKNDLSKEHLLQILEEVDLLCSSGDNGRQMAAVGGIKTLLTISANSVSEVAQEAMRALSSCAQNNPKVYNVAVSEDGIEKLVNQVLGNTDNAALRAAALRALVAISDAEEAALRLRSRKHDIGVIVTQVIAKEPEDKEERRCLIRTLALVERCLIVDKEWMAEFRKLGLHEKAESAVGSADADVREEAARVLSMLR